ncbi:MAG: hypothetical protein R3C28_04945 [Pirellulaceae bacterium]
MISEVGQIADCSFFACSSLIIQFIVDSRVFSVVLRTDVGRIPAIFHIGSERLH